MIKIKKGLTLPITGQPEATVHDGAEVKTVALLGSDYVGMKPTMLVAEGDKVKKGQVIFVDKKLPEVKYTSPGAGTVLAINRGAKRVFQSVVIRLEGKKEETFSSYSAEKLKKLDREAAKTFLLETGLWPTLRTRPFSKTADPKSPPHALFVTAMDTNPLAPPVQTIIEDNKQSFVDGLTLLAKLTEGKTYLCHANGVEVAGADLDFITTESFAGPHPAGNVGTHIHFLNPVSAQKKVWHIDYQDVIAIGKTASTGKLDTDRVISLAGPGVKEPRLIRTRVGASIEDLSKENLKEGDMRVISGSVFSGKTATGPFAYLGRFANQVAVLKEGNEREFLGWQSPGFDKFSLQNVFASKLLPGKKFDFTTSTGGSKRSMVPIGSYEKVMPLDILPTQLLRSLLYEDTEEAQQLGCLELHEEDLALCTFVCPSKYDYGAALRKNLTKIEKDG